MGLAALHGSGLLAWDSVNWLKGLGCRSLGLGFNVWRLGGMMWQFEFRTWGFWVELAGFRTHAGEWTPPHLAQRMRAKERWSASGPCVCICTYWF